MAIEEQYAIWWVHLLFGGYICCLVGTFAVWWVNLSNIHALQLISNVMGK